MTKVYEVKLNRKGAPDFSTAKERVHCRDCRFFCELIPGTIPVCLRYGDFTENDYCSHGEAK